MKLVIFFIAGVLVFFGFKALVKGLRLSHTLITYNGRTCSYWEAKLWPDEYIRGWVFKTAILSPRIDLRTGTKQEVTPPQAAAVLDWIFETYPVTSNGAVIDKLELVNDAENRQKTLIWRFNKAPSRGISEKAQEKMVDDILSQFTYIHVDKWPLKAERFIDDNQEHSKKVVLDDLTRRGF